MCALEKKRRFWSGRRRRGGRSDEREIKRTAGGRHYRKWKLRIPRGPTSPQRCGLAVVSCFNLPAALLRWSSGSLRLGKRQPPGPAHQAWQRQRTLQEALPRFPISGALISASWPVAGSQFDRFCKGRAAQLPIALSRPVVCAYQPHLNGPSKAASWTTSGPWGGRRASPSRSWDRTDLALTSRAPGCCDVTFWPGVMTGRSGGGLGEIAGSGIEHEKQRFRSTRRTFYLLAKAHFTVAGSSNCDEVTCQSVP